MTASRTLGVKSLVGQAEAADSRARQMAEAQEALQRADAKAGMLLQLVGLELAGVMALLSATPSGAAEVMLGLALAPTLIAIVLLLLTILPRLGPPLPGTWLHAASEVRSPVSADTSTDITSDTTGPGAEERRLRRIACRAYEKYRYLQVAVWLLITGLVPLTVGVALIA